MADAAPRSPSFRLDDRRALVTGAGRWIGRAAALALADAGAAVTLVSRTGDELAAVAADIPAAGGRGEVAVLDVTDTASVAAFTADRPAFHVLVANAGTNRPADVLEVTEEDFDTVFALNARAAFFTAQAVARAMARDRVAGSIVMLSSQMGHVGGPRRSVYCGSKFALEGFTKAMALDLAAKGDSREHRLPDLRRDTADRTPARRSVVPAVRRGRHPHGPDRPRRGRDRGRPLPRLGRLGPHDRQRRHGRRRVDGAMTGRLLIGCGAGFSGDRVDAAIPVVREMRARGGPAVLFFETLGERTLALAQLRKAQDPEAGYEPYLEEILRPILADCLDGGIRIVGNFGQANPRAAARLIARLAGELGRPHARIGVVEGDDVTALHGEGALTPLELDEVVDDAPPICANAYLGAAPVERALGEGADVVVTGRLADPALALGPALWHFGWALDDWDRLAAGTLCGHFLECGAQVTGGYFADPGLKDVPDLAEVGFPIAELAADGTMTITKPRGTGGVVSRATVIEQLLYEVHDPASYLTPDVVLDMRGVTVAASGPDRVAVAGARGRPRPERLKVTVSVDGAWLGEGEISYAGPNAAARARLALDVLRRRVPPGLRVRGDLIGVESVFGAEDAPRSDALPEEGDVRARLAVEAPDRDTAERAVREVTALLCCGPAGGGGARTAVRPRVHTWSATAPRARVEAGVSVAVRRAHDWRGREHG